MVERLKKHNRARILTLAEERRTVISKHDLEPVPPATSKTYFRDVNLNAYLPANLTLSCF